VLLVNANGDIAKFDAGKDRLGSHGKMIVR
jgi:hypothetical protein